MCVRDASLGYNFYPYNNCIFEGPVVLNFKKEYPTLNLKMLFLQFLTSNFCINIFIDEAKLATLMFLHQTNTKLFM